MNQRAASRTPIYEIIVILIRLYEFVTSCRRGMYCQWRAVYLRQVSMFGSTVAMTLVGVTIVRDRVRSRGYCTSQI